MSIIFVICLLSIVVLLIPSSPMSKDKVAHYLTKIASHQDKPGGRHDMQALADFFSEDDGQPFYTVNLYQYHEQAQYIDDTDLQVSGEQAYGKFSQVMVPLLLQHYAYPIFASHWLGYSDKKWDRIVIVRYPNREAMAKIFASKAFSQASAHKWASIKQHDRFIVQATHLPEFIVIAFAMMLVILTFLLTRYFYRTLNS